MSENTSLVELMIKGYRYPFLNLSHNDHCSAMPVWAEAGQPHGTAPLPVTSLPPPPSHLPLLTPRTGPAATCALRRTALTPTTALAESSSLTSLGLAMNAAHLNHKGREF